MEHKIDKKSELIKLIKFGITGVFNTVIDLALSTLFMNIFLWNPNISKAISYSAGVVNSYIFNKTWTFKSKEKFFSAESIKFIVLNVIGLLCSQMFIYLFIHIMHIDKNLSNLLATCFTLGINFLGSRLWVFQSKSKTVSE